MWNNRGGQEIQKFLSTPAKRAPRSLLNRMKHCYRTIFCHVQLFSNLAEVLRRNRFPFHPCMHMTEPWRSIYNRPGKMYLFVTIHAQTLNLCWPVVKVSSELREKRLRFPLSHTCTFWHETDNSSIFSRNAQSYHTRRRLLHVKKSDDHHALHASLKVSAQIPFCSTRPRWPPLPRANQICVFLCTWYKPRNGERFSGFQFTRFFSASRRKCYTTAAATNCGSSRRKKGADHEKRGAVEQSGNVRRLAQEM